MFSTLMDTLLDLYVLAIGQDASGGTTRTIPSAPTAKGILCAVQPLNSREQFDYQRREIEADYKIYSEYNFDANLPGGIKLGDNLKDPATGFVYVVMSAQRFADTVISAIPYYKIITKRIIA